MSSSDGVDAAFVFTVASSQSSGVDATTAGLASTGESVEPETGLGSALLLFGLAALVLAWTLGPSARRRLH